MAEANEPNPLFVRNLMTGFQKTAALRAAIDLRVCTYIGEGTRTIEELAKRCDASPRGLRILCDFLTVEGLLSKEQETYSLTPTSVAFLDERSPQCMAQMVKFLNSPLMMKAYDGLAETVRRGGTVLSDGGLAGDDAEEWVNFARFMQPNAGGPARFIADWLVAESKPTRVLDIAAGHGLFGVEIALHSPAAQIVAQDWPQVLQVAQESALAAAIQTRYQVLPGSAFDVDFGGGFDLVLLANFLHHFDDTSCRQFLRKVYACLIPGGRLAIVEFIPNEDRVTPPVAAQFAMTMLVQTPAGDAYTFADLCAMLDAAGFAGHLLVDIPKSPQRLLRTRRP